jgi:hypothetical protein
MIIQQGRLAKPFRGFRNQQVRFQFAQGATWRQHERKYVYHYINSPVAIVVEEGGCYYLQVKGLEERVAVTMEI